MQIIEEAIARSELEGKFEDLKQEAKEPECSPFAGGNRHERRKQAALARKESSPETEKL